MVIGFPKLIVLVILVEVIMFLVIKFLVLHPKVIVGLATKQVKVIVVQGLKHFSP